MPLVPTGDAALLTIRDGAALSMSKLPAPPMKQLTSKPTSFVKRSVLTFKLARLDALYPSPLPFTSDGSIDAAQPPLEINGQTSFRVTLASQVQLSKVVKSLPRF